MRSRHRSGREPLPMNPVERAASRARTLANRALRRRAARPTSSSKPQNCERRSTGINKQGRKCKPPRGGNPLAGLVGVKRANNARHARGVNPSKTTSGGSGIATEGTEHRNLGQGRNPWQTAAPSANPRSTAGRHRDHWKRGEREVTRRQRTSRASERQTPAACDS